MQYYRTLSKVSHLLLLNLSVSLVIFAQRQTDLPADPQASAETRNLYHNLKRIAVRGFMFGHQDDLAYGVHWKYQPGRSDVREVCGDYPAVYGWELSGIETEDSNNIDGVPFSLMRQFIKDGYRRGGVITLSWHMKSPEGASKGAWDTSPGTVASILPGGVHHEMYKTWLDRMAKFVYSLKGTQGEPIPVMFRPFHELTGNWFWWGRTACSPEEYKQLWRWTVHYLQSDKKLHNILWVYNTSGDIQSEGSFLERYPGDDMADVLSFDAYDNSDYMTKEEFEKNFSAALAVIERSAKGKNKLFAVAETGSEAIPSADWWTGVLAKTIGEHKISYVLVWRNNGYSESMKHMHYYAPYPGQVSADDFVKFFSLDKTLFQKDVAKERLYENKN